MPQLLIVNDDPKFAPELLKQAERDGFEVSAVATVSQARQQFKNNHPDILLLDLRLLDGDGLDLVRELSLQDTTHIVVMTGYPSVDIAVGALRERVGDYLVKPFDAAQMRRTLAKVKVEKTGSNAKIPQGEENAGDKMTPLGNSPSIKKMRGWIKKVAPSMETVFLYGETGTGKEVLAQSIHHYSGRKAFQAVNCGSIPTELIASTLFGHEKGSFTGASRQQKGLFESASGGTLFLDEITEMSVELQVNLLRVLETNSIVRVGSDTEIPVDVRVIAATNRNPNEAVEEEVLREDLYYRLMVLPFELTPLRARKEDIPLLAEHFVATLNDKYRMDKSLSPEAVAWLCSYNWPGNVRQLKHIIHRAYILCDGDIQRRDFPDTWFAKESHSSNTKLNVGTSLEEMEHELIIATLDHFEGDKKTAADVLGISLKTLYNRLSQYKDEGVIEEV